MPATSSIYYQPNPLLRGSFPLLAIFLFAIYSAFIEVLPFIGNLRPQLILAALGLLAVFGTGQFMKVLSSRIGICMVAFTAWFIACVPFGAWPGGSAHVFIEQWYKVLLMFIMAAGILTTVPQAKRLFHVIAYGAGILSLITLLKNNRAADGRLVLDNTRYANANDLAWTLLVGLTFVGYMFMRGNRTQKVIAVLMSLPILVTMSRTGSRAGAMGAVILFFLMVFQSGRSTRAKLLAASPILAMVVLAFMSRNMLLRYTTYFGTYDVYNISAEEKLRMGTIASTEARKQLLLDSLNVTVHHPFLGVGPGNFPVVQNEMAIARGEPALWHLTHNTYTQLSSEMGLPGLGIYLVMLYFAFKTLNSILRTKTRSQSWDDLRSLALTLRMAFILFIPIAFFDALAYNADLPIIAGMITAVGFMAQKQRALDRRAAAEAAVQSMAPEDSMLEPVPAGTY